MTAATGSTDEAVRQVAARSQRVVDAVLCAVVAAGTLLRTWDLGSSPAIIDETYTVLSVRLPLGSMLGHLDRTDPHPPLSYLLLKPLAALGEDLGWLRLLSAVLSSTALVVMAVWMRRKGVAGVVAVALLAVAPYQLTYAREVRMYGLLCLGGVLAAWCAERWLVEARPRWAVGAATAGAVVALSHATGVVLLVALMAVPLLRRDQAAWRYRAAIGGAASLFVVLAGRHLLTWHDTSGQLPTSSLRWLSVFVNELVVPSPDERWLILPLLAAGGGLLLRSRSATARVWVCLFLCPVVILFLASFSRGVLVPRSLMPFSWGPAVALGALAGWAWERRAVFGVAVAAVLFVAVVPLARVALHQDDGSREHTLAVLRGSVPGTAFLYPNGLWQADSLLRYHAPEAALALASVPTPVPGHSMLVVGPVGTEPEAIWYLDLRDRRPPEGLSVCGPPRPMGLLDATCVRVPVTEDDSP